MFLLFIEIIFYANIGTTLVHYFFYTKYILWNIYNSFNT